MRAFAERIIIKGIVMSRRLSVVGIAVLVCFSVMVSGCGKKAQKTDPSIQMAAIGGEDIPLTTTVEGIDFMDIEDSAFAGSEAEMVFRDVHFPYNNSRALSDEEFILKDIAAFMSKNADVIVLVEGHCDERGTAEYNHALGEKRALYVRSFLIALGVDPSRIHTISYGEEKPLDFGHDEYSWGQNRRAHFRIARS